MNPLDFSRNFDKKIMLVFQKTLEENNINVKVLNIKNIISNDTGILRKSIIYFEYKNKEYNVEYELKLSDIYENKRYEDTPLEKIKIFIKEIDNEELLSKCDNNKQIRKVNKI